MNVYFYLYEKVSAMIFALGILSSISIYSDEPLSSTQIEGPKYSLVFIYIGEKLPDYLPITIGQAKLFNKNAQIFLIANESSLKSHPDIIKKLKNYDVHFAACEQLNRSSAHDAFDRRFNALAISGYWRYVIERFFYLDELIQQYKLTNVFQIEADVMVYIDLEKFLPIIKDYYPGIAAPFQNDCVASVSFIYFANGIASEDFSNYIETKIQSNYLEPDMVLLASYKNARTDKEIDYLPTIPQEYLRKGPLRNKRGESSAHPWKYWNHVEEWGSIFDPDGLGTLLTQGRWEFNQALFDPDYFLFQWELDEDGRRIPYLYSAECLYAPQKRYRYRVNTLHIFYKQFKGCGSFDLQSLPSRRGSLWH